MKVVSHMTISVLLLGAAAPGLFAQHGGNGRPLNICEVLKRLNGYRGKVVTVTGRLYVSREIAILEGVGCARKFVTDGHVWPPAINLVGSDSPPQQDDHPVSFETEVGTMRRLIDLGKQAQGGKEVWVTLVGQIRARKKYVPVHTRYGAMWNGYGHLAVNPAELVIKALIDARVK